MVEVFIKREVKVSVQLKMTYKGCPAHMGSLTYPGHPAEPPEYDVVSVTPADGVPLSEYEKDLAIDAALEKAYEQGET